ncbi:MAG: hypothetical protein JXR97_08555, partial [Planctomycetes bacterium]|nr:hypothetical protein [Planctomycetota bacterium]
ALVTIGVRHRQLMNDLKEAITDKKPRFSTDTSAMDVLTGNEANFSSGFIGAYPVNTFKSLMGELITMMQLSGLPLQMRSIVSKVHQQIPDSPSPFVFGFGTDKGNIVMYGETPLGGVMDVARLLNAYANSFDTANQNAGDFYARTWVSNIQQDILRQLLPMDGTKNATAGKKKGAKKAEIVPEEADEK